MCTYSKYDSRILDQHNVLFLMNEMYDSVFETIKKKEKKREAQEAQEAQIPPHSVPW